ncbi:hypothetical protein [Sphingobacterium chungjuense]|uniref:hypothetical protein n=1 Tax=Sphingobacterium chungjuense TaxID=2675553 RepID=UPI001407729E|nr:hypothetical protein [Sphingobacterium chungjuense]
MKKNVIALLVVVSSFTAFSFSSDQHITTNDIRFIKDGFHVQVFYEGSMVTGIEVTIGGPNTPAFFNWTPSPGRVNSGCFTGVIYVEGPEGEVILDVNCNN